MERMAAFKPAQSPPEVKMPILFMNLYYSINLDHLRSLTNSIPINAS